MKKTMMDIPLASDSMRHYQATMRCFGNSGCGLCLNSIQPTEIEIATSDHAIIPSNVMGFFIGEICQKLMH